MKVDKKVIALYISTIEGNHSSHVKFGGWDLKGIEDYKKSEQLQEYQTVNKNSLAVNISYVDYNY